MNIELYDLIVKSASEGLKIQKTEGEYAAGHNGPWNDDDTNVRTTAHWAQITFKAYEITSEERFVSSTIKACDYLIKKECHPYGYTFYCRTNQTASNMCNGLIGQAWAIEPLIFIGKRLSIAKYLQVARDVALIHQYSKRNHVWNNVEINGKTSINRTLNQQLWFSALSLITGKILQNKKLNDSARDFFINLPLLVSYVEEKGLIRHDFNGHPCTFRSTVKKIISGKIKRAGDHDRIKLLSKGYLSFVLYGLALAYESCKEEYFWNDNNLKIIICDAINYIIKNLSFGWGEKLGYSWCYNPTGIEMAYVLQVFQEYLNLEYSEKYISLLLTKQFELYYDFEKNMLFKNTTDPAILSARLYETVRLKNYNICMPN